MLYLTADAETFPNCRLTKNPCCDCKLSFYQALFDFDLVVFVRCSAYCPHQGRRRLKEQGAAHFLVQIRVDEFVDSLVRFERLADKGFSSKRLVRRLDTFGPHFRVGNGSEAHLLESAKCFVVWPICFLALRPTITNVFAFAASFEWDFGTTAPPTLAYVNHFSFLFVFSECSVENFFFLCFFR